MLDTHEQECCRLRASIMDFELEQGEKDDVIRDLQAQLKADKDSRSAAEASFDARLKKQKDATSAAKKERNEARNEREVLRAKLGKLSVKAEDGRGAESRLWVDGRAEVRSEEPAYLIGGLTNGSKRRRSEQK